MANTIRVKRGSLPPSVTQLPLDGELGYSRQENRLYINDEGVIIPLMGGGSGGGTGGDSIQWNILENSTKETISTKTLVGEYDMSEVPTAGEEVTIVFRGEIPTELDGFSIGYNIAGNLGTVNRIDNTNLYSWTFTWPEDLPISDQQKILITTTPALDGYESSIEWIKMVRDAKTSKDWFPSKGDLANAPQYVHIRYAIDSTGGDMVVAPTPTHPYIGIAITNSTTPPADVSRYSWTRYIGQDGKDGISEYTHFAYAKAIGDTSDAFTDFSTTNSFEAIYLGTYTGTLETAPQDPLSYKWSRIRGEDGRDGKDGLQGAQGLPGQDGKDGLQGIQGPPGKDGLPSYTHIAYANNETGTSGFSLTDSVNKLYIGMYVDSTEDDSPDPSRYKWTLIKGADGANGIPGAPGSDGKTPYLHIAYADNATGTVGFSTTDSVGKSYIGQYTDFVEQDSTDPDDYKWTLIKGEDGRDGVDGKDGKDGKDGVDGEDGISSYTYIRYSPNEDGSDMTASPQDDSVYIGLSIAQTSTPPTAPTSYTWSKFKGNDGTAAEPNYTWIKYADTPTTGMSDSPALKKYIGIAYNKRTSTPSTDYSDYTWSELGDQKALEDLKETATQKYTEYESRFEVHEEAITNSVSSETYYDSIGGLETSLKDIISSETEQTTNAFNFKFQAQSEIIEKNAGEVDVRLNSIESYFRVTPEGLELGNSENPIILRIKPDRIAFEEGGQEVAYISDSSLYITHANIVDSMQWGKFRWVHRDNGNFSLV